MTAMGWVITWAIVAPISVIAAGLMAVAKGRDHSFWSAWAFLFPPVLILLFMLPSNPRRPASRRHDDEETIEA